MRQGSANEVRYTETHNGGTHSGGTHSRGTAFDGPRNGTAFDGAHGHMPLRSASGASGISQMTPSHRSPDYRYGLSERRQPASGIRKVVTIVASIVYWPVAIVGVTAPFLPGFNPGNLAMWQAVFSRFWLAFALLGFAYALVIDLGGIRSAHLFDSGRPLKIAVALIADVALSFVLIRIVCML